jgi:hypothetical protein
MLPELPGWLLGIARTPNDYTQTIRTPGNHLQEPNYSINSFNSGKIPSTGSQGFICFEIRDACEGELLKTDGRDAL